MASPPRTRGAEVTIRDIAEFMAVAKMAQARGLSVMPHSAHFGVGYFTTWQLLAGLNKEPLQENLYVALDGDLAVGGAPPPQRGTVANPQVSGYGFGPNMDILERYRVG